MFRQGVLRFSWFVLFAGLISSCGGGGDNGAGDFGLSRGECTEFPSTDDRYLITSYHACAAASEGLEGLWMVVSSQDVDGKAAAFDGVQRFVLLIRKLEADTYSLSAINKTIGIWTAEVSADEVELSIVDPLTDIKILMAASGNNQMMGEYVANVGEVVRSSSVSARRIADVTGDYGLLDLEFRLEDNFFERNNLSLEGFQQSLGVRTLFLAGQVALPPLEEVLFVRRIAYLGEERMALMLTLSTPGGDLLAAAMGLPGGSSISGTDPDNFDVYYHDNNAQRIEMDAYAEDDGSPENYVAFSARVAC